MKKMARAAAHLGRELFLGKELCPETP